MWTAMSSRNRELPSKSRDFALFMDGNPSKKTAKHIVVWRGKIKSDNPVPLLFFIQAGIERLLPEFEKVISRLVEER